VVVATGEQTEIGRISILLEQVEAIATPLLRQVAQFGRWLSLAILVVAGATFVTGVLWRGQTMDDMFMAAVALAVAAIPEGLPAIMTIILAIGVQRMATRNAIIRRLPAVETLGSVTVICSDKTGTLTRNEMTVQRVVTADRIFEVSGVGYAPIGGFSVEGEPIMPEDAADLPAIARAVRLCNDANLREHDGEWRMDGDPTEGALLTLALKSGLDPVAEQARFRRLDSIPFESEHRFMATLHHDHHGEHVIHVKGAPERVLAMCADEQHPTARAPCARRIGMHSSKPWRRRANAYWRSPTGRYPKPSTS
jgi:magnesium-transporting ATPase (P-type)